MSFLLTALGVLFGILLLLLSLTGIVFGLYMIVHQKTREQGVFFVLWWVPAAAAAAGILLRDPVTFVVGALCFVVAGAALVVEQRSSRSRPKGRGRPTAGSTGAREHSAFPNTQKAERWLPEIAKKAKRWLPGGGQDRERR